MNLCRWLSFAEGLSLASATNSPLRGWIGMITSRRSSHAQAKASREQAWALLEDGDFDGAIELFTSCLAHHSKCADATRGRELAFAFKRVQASANDNRQRPRRVGPSQRLEGAVDDVG